MKLCDTCIYRNNVEQLKPCVVYRDDCEYYKKERGDMSREEAIKELQESHDIMRSYDIDESESRLMIALDMAIKALEQEPCDDLISRQAVLEAMCDASIPIIHKGKPSFIVNYVGVLETVPSVNPQEPKTGHWIKQNNTNEPLYGWYFCSECNSVIGDKTKFCSNCGCRMVEPQESEDEE